MWRRIDDTVVARGTTLYGKPRNKHDAFRMLAELAGNSHDVLTGVCLLHLRNHRQSVFAEQTAVQFHKLTPAKIRGYVERVHTLDKAGAYAVQGEGRRFVRRVEGSESNVIGLPLDETLDLLRAAGWETGSQ